MKHPSYNGVCVSIISKTGDFKNVPIAMAMIPSETTDNFLWVFLNLRTCVVPMDNMAVFSDRGKQMNAAKRLSLFGFTWLHIKNCTLHIAKNVCSRFSPKVLKYPLFVLVFSRIRFKSTCNLELD
jgi:hypothetical protein